ncbi:MAG TPA: glycosyltransferase family 4 protein [Terriglobales bacterium]|nr:glycosyltransferase family 4 protein [Terriglobales bacterium]
MTGSNTVVSLLNLNPRKFGSLEEYLVCLSTALRSQGCRSVLAFPQAVTPELEKQFEQSGVVLERFSLASTFSLYRGLLGILRKYRPAVVHFHFFDQFSLLPLLAALTGCKLVVFTDHCRLPQARWRTRLKCKLMDRLVLGPLGVRVIAVSEHVRRTLVDCYSTSPARIRVIRNGVSLQRFGKVSKGGRQTLLAELGIAEGARIVVTAAYFIPEKGLSDLLVAAARVRAARQDVAFVIVGDGPLQQALLKQSQELGLEGTVHFAGLRSDVDRFMGAADVVVVPSVWQEPAGLVVVEAMASARPAVATRVGGIPEYLADRQTGLLVEPHSPSQMAEAILSLLESPSMAMAMGAAGRARAEALFSMSRWVEETLDLYDSVLPASRQPAPSRLMAADQRSTAPR